MTPRTARTAARWLGDIDRIRSEQNALNVSGYPLDGLISNAAAARIKAAVDAEVDREIADIRRELAAIGVVSSVLGNAGADTANRSRD